jgi:DNA-binding NarL/FixJ family response regulator
MKNIRVLVMQKESLLNQALANILKNSECEISVITSGASELKGLIAETTKLKPDIVILGESTPMAGQDGLGYLLMSNPELQVIVVSEDTNYLHIFHKKDKLMTRQTDLLDLLCAG